MFFFNKKKKNSSMDNSIHSAKTEDIPTNSSPKVTLKKSEEGLNRYIVRLKKDVDLSTHRARVFVVIDCSASMRLLYYNGSIQDVLTRLLPLALKFDDDCKLEVYIFNNSFQKITAMTEENYENYVEKLILNKGLSPFGGTSYAPVIKKTIEDYNDGNPFPAFGIFITDGNNDDHSATDYFIKESANYRIFYQFVGIGNEDFHYLKKLDNLKGSKFNNTSFITVTSFTQLNDEELYSKLLEQYVNWLKKI